YRIMVIVYDRQTVQIFNFRCARIEVKRLRTSPAQTGNAGEVSGCQIFEDVRKNFIGLISDDYVELGKALENLPVQHSSVRTAQEGAQFRATPVKDRRQNKKKKKPHPPCPKGPSPRARAQPLRGSRFVERGIESQPPRFNQTLGIDNLHRVAV